MLIAVCVILILVFMPSLAKTRPKAHRIVCVNNLKQVGLATRIFAVENGDLLPYAAHSNQVKLAALTAGAYYAWITNELTTPKVLVCPTDVSRREAASWTNLQSKNLSYFIGLNADETRPESILGGDRNLTMGRMRLPSGVARGTNLAVLGWSPELHEGNGNLAMGDGSVRHHAASYINQMRTNFLHNGEWKLLMP